MARATHLQVHADITKTRRIKEIRRAIARKFGPFGDSANLRQSHFPGRNARHSRFVHSWTAFIYIPHSSASVCTGSNGISAVHRSLLRLLSSPLMLQDADLNLVHPLIFKPVRLPPPTLDLEATLEV